MHILSNDLILRHFYPEDAPRLAQLADNPRVARFLKDRFPHPYRLEDANGWIALTQSETRPCNFAIEWRGELVGGAGLVPLQDVHSGTAEIGYWLGEPYWGLGIAAKAVKMLVAYAFDDLLFIRVQAGVFAENTASMRVLEKNGFVREAVMRKHVRKNGVVMDAVLYAKLRNG